MPRRMKSNPKPGLEEGKQHVQVENQPPGYNGASVGPKDRRVKPRTTRADKDDQDDEEGEVGPMDLDQHDKQNHQHGKDAEHSEHHHNPNDAAPAEHGCGGDDLEFESDDGLDAPSRDGQTTANNDKPPGKYVGKTAYDSIQFILLVTYGLLFDFCGRIDNHIQQYSIAAFMAQAHNHAAVRLALVGTVPVGEARGIAKQNWGKAEHGEHKKRVPDAEAHKEVAAAALLSDIEHTNIYLRFADNEDVNEPVVQKLMPCFAGSHESHGTFLRTLSRLQALGLQVMRGGDFLCRFMLGGRKRTFLDADGNISDAKTFNGCVVSRSARALYELGSSPHLTQEVIWRSEPPGVKDQRYTFNMAGRWLVTVPVARSAADFFGVMFVMATWLVSQMLPRSLKTQEESGLDARLLPFMEIIRKMILGTCVVTVRDLLDAMGRNPAPILWVCAALLHEACVNAERRAAFPQAAAHGVPHGLATSAGHAPASSSSSSASSSSSSAASSRAMGGAAMHTSSSSSSDPPAWSTSIAGNRTYFDFSTADKRSGQGVGHATSKTTSRSIYVHAARLRELQDSCLFLNVNAAAKFPASLPATSIFEETSAQRKRKSLDLVPSLRKAEEHLMELAKGMLLPFPDDVGSKDAVTGAAESEAAACETSKPRGSSGTAASAVSAYDALVEDML